MKRSPLRFSVFWGRDNDDVIVFADLSAGLGERHVPAFRLLPPFGINGARSRLTGPINPLKKSGLFRLIIENGGVGNLDLTTCGTA